LPPADLSGKRLRPVEPLKWLNRSPGIRCNGVTIQRFNGA
jgi:hypothetical protein